MNRSTTAICLISPMPETVDFHPLFTQLQSRYPTSSLLCELVQIYEGNFIVRAVVQVGGETLVTSMASAVTVEQAEDQARLRVLKLLGIHSIASTLPSFQSSGFDRSTQRLASSLTPEPVPALATSAPPAPATATSFREANPTSMPPFSFETPATSEPSDSKPSALPRLDEPDLFSASRIETGVAVMSQPASDSEEKAPPPRNGKSRKAAAKPEVAPVPPPVNEPLDLTPLFLQIEGEMERIGWTKEQGRSHLQRTYNKRSRQQLTDEELIDFLNYLKTYPAADDALFRE